MKASINKLKNVVILFIITTISIVIATLYLSTNNTNHQKAIKLSDDRTSITFIMGEDEPNSNKFYTNATYYYNMHPVHKTDKVIYNVSNLQAIVDYLNSKNSTKKYGMINIVSHGNPWQGLSFDISKELPRTNFPNLEFALENNMIKPLCSNYVDDFTQINIISCGVGKNKDFSNLIAKVFMCKSSRTKPSVNLESNFVNFTDKMQKKVSSFYFVSSKYEYSQPDIVANRLKAKYLNKRIDWKAGYLNKKQHCDKEPYHHGFRMVVEWKIGFDHIDDIPNLNNDAAIISWLKTQNPPMAELKKMQLNVEDFQWHRLPVTDQPLTIKIKGYSNVQGVLVDFSPDDIGNGVVSI